MKRFRWLLLAAIAAILAAVAGSYLSRTAQQASESPPPPPELPPNITATSDTWVHTEYDGERPVVEIRAKKMRQLREPATFELEGVELRIFQPGGYDRVRCGRAEFDIEKSLLYSEGPVEMTLDVPEAGTVDESSLVRIESSHVKFDTKTGRVTTGEPARFRFPRGEGRSTGATYDPRWKDLRMHHDVELRWYGNDPEHEILVEAGSLVYKEDQDKVYLSPWSRFRKGALELDAANSVVALKDGSLDRIDAWRASGRHGTAGRKTEFGAAHLVMIWGPDMAIQKIVGEGSARLISRTGGSGLTASGERLFLDFRTGKADSVLEHALLMGSGRLRMLPAGKSSQPGSSERVLTSEVIHAYLRADGSGFEKIETGAPGTVEFIPIGAEGVRRKVEGDRIWMLFAPGNRLELFRAQPAATWTAPPPGSERPARRTWSDDFIARFDTDSGELIRIDQTGNFRLEQGDQHARADKGVFEPTRDIFLLLGTARIADARGSTSADRILWDQRQDAVTAEGNVASTRLPDNKASQGGLLTPGEPVHARAAKMLARNAGAVVVYEGNAVLWQGADRIQADRIVIDREKRTLSAAGNVITRLRMQEAEGQGSAPPRFTVVQAKEFFYAAEHRMAQYRGQVRLTQPGLEVISDGLQAFFAAQNGAKEQRDGGRKLERLIAEGNVRVIMKEPGRVRTGVGERAEYYLAEEKLVLRGGRPKLIDSERGTAQGDQLTYYARNDRLLVDGDEVRPAVSRLRTRQPRTGPGGGE